MGWQDILGGALTGFATGNPMAWKNQQLEQAFKQFQMQKMTDELEMQREMHGMEKQKIDILLKQKQREEELDNSPIGGILKIFGIDAPEGSENVTVGQATAGGKVADIFRKQEPKPVALGGKGIWTKEGGFEQAPWTGEGEENRPYKIGQILPSREVGDRNVSYQVTGYDENNMPTLKEVTSGPRYKPSGPEKERKPHEIGKDASGLRKELNNLPEVKEYNTVKTKISAMEAAYKEAQTTKNFVAADQAMITLFNKMTDPQSVVRESEYARTGVSMSLINAIKGKVNKVLAGGAGLTPSERDAIMKMARLFDTSYKTQYGSRVKEYREYATMQGLNPDMVAKEEKVQQDPLGIR